MFGQAEVVSVLGLHGQGHHPSSLGHRDPSGLSGLMHRLQPLQLPAGSGKQQLY